MPEKSDLRKKVGNSGESRAKEYLIKNGYEIVATNYRVRGGEIDIVAHKADAGCSEGILVFVEVKTLPSGNMELLSKELNLQKQKRIVETAKYFILNNRKYSNCYIRFDVVVVDMPALPEVYHIENAFSEFS
ncbi:MAG: YraN family protein [Treponema sp.]|nr:YraN family protein [Treponema sp.]